MLLVSIVMGTGDEAAKRRHLSINRGCCCFAAASILPVPSASSSQRFRRTGRTGDRAAAKSAASFAVVVLVDVLATGVVLGLKQPSLKHTWCSRDIAPLILLVKGKSAIAFCRI
jgi:hypothetical protein